MRNERPVYPLDWWQIVQNSTWRHWHVKAGKKGGPRIHPQLDRNISVKTKSYDYKYLTLCKLLSFKFHHFICFVLGKTHFFVMKECQDFKTTLQWHLPVSHPTDSVEIGRISAYSVNIDYITQSVGLNCETVHSGFGINNGEIIENTSN